MRTHSFQKHSQYTYCVICGCGPSDPLHEYKGDETQAIREKRIEDTKKPSNPKDTIGSTKPPASTVPLRVLALLGVAMLEGTCKYGRHNYRDAGVRASVYYDAARRHMDKWFEGEDIDPDSGLPHVVKAMASLLVLQDGILEGNFTDDRPPKIDPRFWIELEAMTKAVLAKFPNPVPPFTEKGRTK